MLLARIGQYYVAPGNIDTPPTPDVEGYWKFLKGKGVSTAELFKGKYEAELEFKEESGI